MTASFDLRRRAQLLAPELAPYLDADGPGVLLMPRCRTCGRRQWPPRPSCRTCGGDGFEPDRVNATGSLYSWTTTHIPMAPELAPLTPYTIVIVTLDVPEGLRVVGRLRETNRVPDLTAGLRMSATREENAGPLPLLLWEVDDR